jgi:hypothetical protein
VPKTLCKNHCLAAAEPALSARSESNGHARSEAERQEKVYINSKIAEADGCVPADNRGAVRFLQTPRLAQSSQG